MSLVCLKSVASITVYRCVNLRKKSTAKKDAAKGFKKGVSKAKKDDKKRKDHKKYMKTLVHKAVKSNDRPSRHGSTEAKSGRSSSRSHKSDSEVTHRINVVTK